MTASGSVPVLMYKSNYLFLLDNKLLTFTDICKKIISKFYTNKFKLSSLEIIISPVNGQTKVLKY